MLKRLIVTHHAPDCDAIGATWMLKRFDAQHHADAQSAFVDPGKTIHPSEAERLGFQLHQVTHVDTGLGEFDHHQPERGLMRICATSLTYEYVCKIHPELAQDTALKEIVAFVTDVDHFGEISWPDPAAPKQNFMFQQLLHGFENVDPHNDESQMQFGLTCFDCAYASMKDTLQAQELVEKEGTPFWLGSIRCLAIQTRNDAVLKQAQLMGYQLVIRKDPKNGDARIKARPDAPLILKPLADRILAIDQVGSWYYHPSGKMLINGSRKQRQQRPTPLTLEQLVEAAKETLHSEGT